MRWVITVALLCSTASLVAQTRIKSEWLEKGHLPPMGDAKYEDHIVRRTTSENRRVKVTIDDLSDRIAMLADVSGRVSLMRRDRALFMRSLASASCNGPRLAGGRT